MADDDLCPVTGLGCFIALVLLLVVNLPPRWIYLSSVASGIGDLWARIELN